MLTDMLTEAGDRRGSGSVFQALHRRAVTLAEIDAIRACAPQGAGYSEPLHVSGPCSAQGLRARLQGCPGGADIIYQDDAHPRQVPPAGKGPAHVLAAFSAIQTRLREGGSLAH